MQNSAKVGLIGLGVMGENLALNIERNRFPIAVFNRTVDKVDAFMADRAVGKQVIPTHSVKEFVAALERPRKIVLLVKAGQAVDETIKGLRPLLESGDIIIDGGNSHYLDTIKREVDLKKDGIYLIGSGVSGGEEGALNGPSLMPGGDRGAYEKIKPIWEAIAAKVKDGPCVTYLGPDGAGHFVKMVHNGIEYGDMQLIAEIYDVFKRGLGLSAKAIAEIFKEWNKGILESFLIEITANILTVEDKKSGKPLVDLILDKAGQKGTGKWTSEAALELGIPTPTIDAALTARLLSAMKEERIYASTILSNGSLLQSVKGEIKDDNDKNKLIQAAHDALYCSKVCSYAQGMALIKAGSDFYNWQINLAEVARIWKGGCIIRAKLLESIQGAFAQGKSIANLLLDPDFVVFFNKAQTNWRHFTSFAQKIGIPLPASGASLSYYDSYRANQLPQNLTQAQRDYFGAHTYERVDHPEAGFVHTDWLALIKTTK